MTRPSAKSDNFFPKVRKAKINTMPYKPFCPKSRKAARAIKMNILFLIKFGKKSRQNYKKKFKTKDYTVREFENNWNKNICHTTGAFCFDYS